MSRSGYDDDYDNYWGMIRWRGAVHSAMSGKRGQAFLRELLAAMDALPQPKLIAHELAAGDGNVCALGSVSKARQINVAEIDPDDSESVAATFGIAEALAREIVYMNDEWSLGEETPEQRFTRMRTWVASHIWDWQEVPDTPTPPTNTRAE